MAKKSNKTEQVLKLITKENEEQDNSDKVGAANAKLPDASGDSDGAAESAESAAPVKAAGPAGSAEPAKGAEVAVSLEAADVAVSMPNAEVSITVESVTPAAPAESAASVTPAGTSEPAEPVAAPAADAGEEPKSTEEEKNTLDLIGEVPAGNGTRRCLLNLTERLVRETAPEVMRRLNVCSCPICAQDVLALTLNLLPPKYVTTDAGRQHLLLEIYKKQYETDIVAALTKAAVRVKVSPRHGE